MTDFSPYQLSKNLILQLGLLYIFVVVLFSLNPLKKIFLLRQVAPVVVEVHQPSSQKKVLSGKPVEILIPQAGIDLEVVDGHYNPLQQDWTLSPTKANFAVISRELNNHDGNTVIYGHNTSAVFGRTRELKKGDYALVKTDNNLEFLYALDHFEAVKPDNTKIFEYQGSPQLTLITCQGTFSSLRKQMYFRLEKVVAKES